MIALNKASSKAQLRRHLGLPAGREKRHTVFVAPWLNWIEQPPPKGQVIGSNPIGVTTLLGALYDVVGIYARLGDRTFDIAASKEPVPRDQSRCDAGVLRA